MSSAPSAPPHRDPAQWLTRTTHKRVLVVVHTLVYGQRLAEVLPLFHGEPRVGVVFTVAPHAFNPGAAEFVRRLGGLLLPWDEAVRTDFDLVLAAGSQGVEQLRGPLLRLAHGAGHIKLSRLADHPERTVGGLGRRYLTWQGRVVPAAIGVAHRSERDQIAELCPEAAPVTEVLGDAVFDRITAALPHRDAHRRALGLTARRRLVLVCCTWGAGSLFHLLDRLLPRLLAELSPARHRIAVLLHPNVWAAHGSWQVGAWLAAYTGTVRLVRPESDWRRLLVAADLVIGDHGSVTLYGTVTGSPVLLGRFPAEDVNPRSPAARLGELAPALDHDRPLAAQLDLAARRYRPAPYREVASLITSEPGRFDRNTRALTRRLLGLESADD